ncbi:lysylphosphatidylglycerol synthase domain-containing protein [Hamadaea tsunoensis]|uniref:lysylphosphatidylglycerol synthase domain-containing protein n=1 Tax=Hamadaea tsunoensis TaxID=53368 RepID=UPI0003FBFB3B|nr:lysylphosphatidylglycerol synthase domain-containing protein [Hamadaea tsunoensis]
MSATELPRPAPAWAVPVRRALTLLLALATAGAIVFVLRDQDWSVLRQTFEHRRPGVFALGAVLAILANVGALVTAMLAWQATLAGVGSPIPAAAAARIFFVGQFAKYMPGKVFSALVSVRMGRTIGVPAVRMMSAWLLTLVIGVLTGATVGLLAAPEILGGSAAWVAVAALPVLVVLVRPGLVNTAVVLAARVRRKEPPDDGVPDRIIRRVLVTQLASWLFGGLQLWFVAVALGAPMLRSLALCVGAFGLSTVAGMFAVFAPEGLGVREVVLMAALGAVLPLPVAGVVALASRLAVIVSELATAAGGLAAAEVLRRRTAAAARPDDEPDGEPDDPHSTAPARPDLAPDDAHGEEVPVQQV